MDMDTPQCLAIKANLIRQHEPTIRTWYWLPIIAVICSPMILSSSPMKQTGPRLSLPQVQLDLGHIARRERLEIPFEVRNIGGQRLVLNRIGGCQCTSDAQRTVIIRPHESTNLVVSLDTQFATGSVSGEVEFQTNDPAQPRIRLTVTATPIGPPVSLMPIPNH